MTGAWLAYALLIGILLAATARCLSEVCRLAGRPTRWVWISALSLTVVLVALAPYRTVPPVPVATTSFLITVPTTTLPASAAGVEAVPVTPGWGDRVRQIGPALTTPIQQAIALAGARVPATLIRHFLLAWVALSALLLALCIATYVRFYRLRRGWPVTELNGMRVRVAPDGGPAVVGWSRPEIIIPHWLLRHTREEQRLVLAHEREHVNARDPLLIALACGIAVLFPWHPAVWWMFARLRLAVELDCDVRVLRQGIAPRTYGALLIDLAGRCPGLPVAAPALADKSSHLRQRLLAMRARRRSFARTRGVALGTFAAFVLIAACAVQVPRVVAQRTPAAAPVETPAPAMAVSLLETTPAPNLDSTVPSRAARRPKRALPASRPTDAGTSLRFELSPTFFVQTSPKLTAIGKPQLRVTMRVTPAEKAQAQTDTLKLRHTMDFLTGELNFAAILSGMAFSAPAGAPARPQAETPVDSVERGTTHGVLSIDSDSASGTFDMVDEITLKAGAVRGVIGDSSRSGIFIFRSPHDATTKP